MTGALLAALLAATLAAAIAAGRRRSAIAATANRRPHDREPGR